MAKQDVELQFKLIDGVSRGLAEIQKGVSGLGASLVKINAAAELTGKAFGAISSVAGAFGDAITGAASVEDALTRVNTITAATVEEQKALQDAVRGAVEGTRFSAEEAAGALVLLAEDGFSAKEAVDQLGSVLQFAQANAQSAAAATGALGAVLDTFGEKPAVIGALADTLTAVARGAGTSTKALQEGLAGVGNAADQAGISLNDTIGYLGLLASRGIEGGAAVGNFNKIIREIEDPASKAGQALATLGLQGADFATVLNRLGKDSVAAETVLSALGRKPREALRVLLQEGGGDLGKFADIIRQSTGATKEASDALNKTFAGALDRITNQLAQTRNELLTPILLPLADEIAALSARISEFAQSPEFDAIVANFTRIASEGIRILGDEIAKIDFTDALNKVIDFSTSFANNMAIIAKAVDITARTIGGFFDVVSITYQSLKGVAADTTAAIIEPLAVFNDSTRALWVELKASAADSEKSVGKSLEKLGERFTGTASDINSLEAAIKSSALAAKVAAGDYKALADSLPKEDGLNGLIDRLRETGLLLDDVKEPAKDAADGIESVGTAAANTAADLERIKIGNLLRQMDELLRSGQQGSAAYKALNAEFLAAEARLNELTGAAGKAKQAQDDLATKTDRAAQSMRNFAGASREAADAADDTSRSNSEVSDSFGNIGNQSSSAAVSMGTLTEEFVRNALAAAGNAKSVRDYLRTLNDFFAQGADEEKQLRDAIEIRERQNAQLTEEDRIRRRIKDQYGESSTLVEKLVQIELKLAEARKKTNDESQRGFEIEQRRAGLAGGIGTQGGPATAAGPATSAGRGSFAGAPRDNSAISITINQNGATPETIRDLAPLIERELGRLGALRR